MRGCWKYQGGVPMSYANSVIDATPVKTSSPVWSVENASRSCLGLLKDYWWFRLIGGHSRILQLKWARAEIRVNNQETSNWISGYFYNPRHCWIGVLCKSSPVDQHVESLDLRRIRIFDEMDSKLVFLVRTSKYYGRTWTNNIFVSQCTGTSTHYRCSMVHLYSTIYYCITSVFCKQRSTWAPRCSQLLFSLQVLFLLH